MKTKKTVAKKTKTKPKGSTRAEIMERLMKAVTPAFEDIAAELDRDERVRKLMGSNKKRDEEIMALRAAIDVMQHSDVKRR